MIIVANTASGGELFGPFVFVAFSVANLFKRVQALAEFRVFDNLSGSVLEVGYYYLIHIKGFKGFRDIKCALVSRAPRLIYF